MMQPGQIQAEPSRQAPSHRALSPQASPLTRGGRALIAWAQQFLYARLMDVSVEGQHHVPRRGGFLVAANHASHLDAGLVKFALGARGAQMRALAASDYFFAQPWSRWYFENFTNVMPLERRGNFRSSLKRALRVARDGSPLLVFPEGTRSRTGEMAPFKPAISSMALMADCPIVPMYLRGTFAALPKGGGMLPRVRSIGASVGPVLPASFLTSWTRHLSRHEAYRRVTALVELSVHALQKGQALYPDELVERYEQAYPHEQTLEQPCDSALRSGARNQDGRDDALRGIA